MLRDAVHHFGRRDDTGPRQGLLSVVRAGGGVVRQSAGTFSLAEFWTGTTCRRSIALLSTMSRIVKAIVLLTGLHAMPVPVRFTVNIGWAGSSQRI